MFTQSETKQIIDWYTKDYLSIRYIAKHLLHKKESAISKVLKDNNVKLRSNNGGRIINPRVEEEIVKLYTNSYYTQTQLGEKFNCSSYVIHNILKRNNIAIVTKPRKNIKQLDNYFDEINSEHKAYWLGFIFADGSVSNSNQLSIEIHEKDKYLLEKFKDDLQLNSKISIRNRKNTTTCCVRVSSPHMVQTLKQYGIVPNKTNVTKHLPKIREDLIPHFLRGLIDGDGWITQDKNGRFHIGYVTNHISVCEDFKTYCNIIIDGKCDAKITYKNHDKHPCFQIQNQKIIKQLASALYKDNTICLSRKYQKAVLIFDYKNDEDIV